MTKEQRRAVQVRGRKNRLQSMGLFILGMLLLSVFHLVTTP